MKWKLKLDISHEVGSLLALGCLAVSSAVSPRVGLPLALGAMISELYNLSRTIRRSRSIRRGIYRLRSRIRHGRRGPTLATRRCRTDLMIVRARALIPPKYRDDLVLTLQDDVKRHREAGLGEREIRFYLIWQYGWAVSKMVPRSAWLALAGVAAAAVRKLT